MNTANNTRSYFLTLSINPDELLKMYRREASEVAAESVDGVKLRFPATSLRPFIHHNGVHGHFRLRVDSNNKLVDIEKVRG